MPDEQVFRSTEKRAPVLPVTLSLRETFCTRIVNSEGSGEYRTLMVRDAQGMPYDILDDGRLSCAYYVSCLLHQFGLINAPHATIDGLLREFDAAGSVWKRHDVSSLVFGAVPVWEPQVQAAGEVHRHVGFYLCRRQAMSHSDQARTPIRHDYKCRSEARTGPERRIEAVYVHPFLLGQ